VAEKNQLNNDIINRFEQYEAEKKETTREREKSYKHLYYPFQPTISNNSRVITSASTRKEHPDKLSKTLHCHSCSHVKQPPTPATSARSPARSPRKNQPLATSKL
jgi:aspartate carbamoyltransferase regulatory subunit